MHKFFSCCLFLALVMTSFACHAQKATKESEELTIGSKAPELDIEHWMSDREGEFKHVTKLESGKVYVIEFWATWCGPCVSAMPSISEMQEDYVDKNVQIISVSDEKLDTVEGFLKRKVSGGDGTFAELTSNYCLTVDPDGSVTEDYFRAAGRSGIPCAFIVGKTGLVEWIGHPMEMQTPLKKIVGDEWDLEAYKKEYQKEKELKAKQRKAQAKLQVKLQSLGQELQELMGDGKPKEAIALLDKALADDDFEVAHDQLGAMRSHILIMEVGGSEAVKALDKLAEENSENPMLLNRVAWTLYEKYEEEGELEKGLLVGATKAAEVAVKAAPEEGAVLDTLAHLVYAGGDLDRAIELQEKAVKFAGSQAAEIEPFLEKLRTEKSKKEEKDK